MQGQWFAGNELKDLVQKWVECIQLEGLPRIRQEFGGKVENAQGSGCMGVKGQRNGRSNLPGTVGSLVRKSECGERWGNGESWCEWPGKEERMKDDRAWSICLCLDNNMWAVSGKMGSELIRWIVIVKLNEKLVMNVSEEDEDNEEEDGKRCST
ncbi:hypothetical protein WH47_04845 [Habropoda laboriosa]|uniref:Uncharacterized protein n=1 Tax=Habropoda laboriosa TaxID=597456 RepID=A0A0L7QWF3_9HYME|nr:hypothetical protein WH47_04845 [Habropoda laboriosa]